MDDILTNVTTDADNPVDTGSDDGDKQVFDQIQGSDNFFEELDKSVNPSFYESDAESQETQETDPPTEAQTEAVDQTQGDHDWEKRYNNTILNKSEDLWSILKPQYKEYVGLENNIVLVPRDK